MRNVEYFHMPPPVEAGSTVLGCDRPAADDTDTPRLTLRATRINQIHAPLEQPPPPPAGENECPDATDMLHAAASAARACVVMRAPAHAPGAPRNAKGCHP